jgi:hypothetical protein
VYNTGAFFVIGSDGNIKELSCSLNGKQLRGSVLLNFHWNLPFTGAKSVYGLQLTLYSFSFQVFHQFAG